MEVRRHRTFSDCEQEYLQCCFTVEENSLVLARLCCYLNPYHSDKSEKALTFGCLDVPNNYEVFTMLFEAVIEEAKNLGCSVLIGPMDGSTWNTYRIVTSPQPDPFFLEVENPPFYKDLFTTYGFETLAKYKSTYADSIEVNWEQNLESYHHFTDIGVMFVPFDKEKCDKIFSELGVLCNESFKNNFLFSPIEIDAFVGKMKLLLSLINPRYTILARHKEKLVGFIFCYQDIYSKNEKTIVVKTLARDPSSIYKGLGSVLSSIAMKNAKADVFTKGIHALMVDLNTSTYISDKFRSKFLRSYELLSYKIEY
jgi:hypothetical protein